MIRTSSVRFVSNPHKLSSASLVRKQSAQAAVSFKPKEDEYANAIPFEQMPGLSKFKFVKRFLPGGKFYKMPLNIMQLSLREEFGDIYRLPAVFGQKTLVTTYNADDVEVIHRNEGTYPYRRALETMKHFRENIRSDVYEVGGLVNEQGEDWYRMRTVINPILMQPKLVKSYIPTIDNIVNDFIANIPSIQDDKGEMPADFNDYLNRWSLESINAIALDKRLGLMDFQNTTGDGLNIAKVVRKIFTLSLDHELKPSIWRYYKTKQFKELMQAHNDLTELSGIIIEEAKQRYSMEPNAESVLSKLLEKDKRYATVMAFDMIFAGIDTTTSALSATMFLLAKNPEKQEILRNELVKIMPDEGSPLTGESMKNMPYLRAVLKEALRLLPPQVGNMRRTSENLVIRGYQVPKGVDILFGMMHMYKDASYFESPDEFIPERWIRTQEAEVCPRSLKQSHPFSYLPFGYGARFCAGKRIAEMELEVFLSRLFRKYKVEWHHPDLKQKFTMINILEGDFKFRMIKL